MYQVSINCRTETKLFTFKAFANLNCINYKPALKETLCLADETYLKEKGGYLLEREALQNTSCAKQQFKYFLQLYPGKSFFTDCNLEGLNFHKRAILIKQYLLSITRGSFTLNQFISVFSSFFIFQRDAQREMNKPEFPDILPLKRYKTSYQKSYFCLKVHSDGSTQKL